MTEKYPPLRFESLDKMTLAGRQLILSPENKSMRAARSEDERNRFISYDLHLLCEFFAVEPITPGRGSGSPTIAPARYSAASSPHFESTHGSRSAAEETASRTAEDLNNHLRKTFGITELYIAVYKDFGKRHVAGGLLSALEAEDTAIYPIVSDYFGKLGRLPVGTAFFKTPLLQKTGPVPLRRR